VTEGAAKKQLNISAAVFIGMDDTQTKDENE